MLHSVINPVLYRAGIYGIVGLLLTACGGGDGTITPSYTVSAAASAGGSISPNSATVSHGATTNFTLPPDTGYGIASVTGCNGSLLGNTYTTGAVTADCTVTANFVQLPPAAPALLLTPQSVKTFNFSWTDVAGETEYSLLEDPDSTSGYTQVANLAADTASHDLVVSLPKRINARYILQACNGSGCTDSAPVSVNGTLVAAVGYVKALSTGADDLFGISVALSGDGNTLAVGAYGEDSGTTGVGSTPDETADGSGAVYVFTRSGAIWSQQTYVKASNTGVSDRFGISVSLSGDGNTLAVGAYVEDSGTIGVGSTPDEAATSAGAVYVFARSSAVWSEQAYVKASNTGAGDEFGISVALSGDGNTLAVGAAYEDSGTTGVGNEPDELASDAGAVYVFIRNGAIWSQQAYVKASNTGADDLFGTSVALSGDGNTLAVGAFGEAGSATGVGRTPNEDAIAAGAVYVFSRSGAAWSEQAYVKASNTGAGDWFGHSVALSGDGNTLAVGANLEDSSATGVDSAPDETALWAGAVYVFTRSGVIWSQQAYVKASNTGANDEFGRSVALSGDGDTLAVGANWEDSSSTGVGSTPNEAATGAGAVYVFTRSGVIWSQQAYVKASNTGASDEFGHSVALSGDGTTLAVGGYLEDSGTIGVGSTPDEAATNAGAVYLY